MIILAFVLSFAASGFALWQASRSVCDQRTANIALGLLPTIIAGVIYFGFSPVEKVIALGLVFMGGIAMAGARGWQRLIPLYQVGFGLWIMLGIPVV